MSSKAREFPREFKLDVCRRIVSKETSKSAVMRAHRLGAGTLERWLEQYSVRGEESFDGGRWRSPDEPDTAETRLRKEIEQLRLENEFLRACLGKLPEEPEIR
jgi:transposase-like protein